MSPVRVDGSAAAAPVGFDARAVMSKAHSENFPVALRVLPRRTRQQLEAIYGYARYVDDIGDRSVGDRLAELDWAEAELDRGLAGGTTEPIFAAIGAAARQLGFERKTLVDLIDANRLDQRVTRYLTFADLERYCALSANPVGRLVLGVFGVHDEVSNRYSDEVCTGLQLVEHWQDVAEDFAAGRLYLPTEDLERFGVEEATIAGRNASAAFRRLLAFECGRARQLLGSGRPLVASLGGWARLAIAGFVGGGLAQLDAIERHGYDVLSSLVKASKPSVALRSASVFARIRERAQ